MQPSLVRHSLLPAAPPHVPVRCPPPPAGSPGLLLAYRLVMLAWGLFIGLRQLQDKGGYVFVFYTGGCWWVLAACRV